MKPLWDLHKKETNPEHELFDSLVTEFNDISGFPVLYYIKQNTDKADYLYGEDANTSYAGPYKTKVLYEVTEEKSMLDVFGITMDEFVEGVHISKSIWKRDIALKHSQLTMKPKVGDVIKFIWNGISYEIVDVGEESKIFQAYKQVYEFILRPYRYSEEDDSKVLFDDDFPNIKFDEDKDLDEFGENIKIGEESKENYDYDGKDTKKIYGYDTLDDDT
jgi:hypothetical protein